MLTFRTCFFDRYTSAQIGIPFNNISNKILYEEKIKRKLCGKNIFFHNILIWLQKHLTCDCVPHAVQTCSPLSRTENCWLLQTRQYILFVQNTLHKVGVFFFDSFGQNCSLTNSFVRESRRHATINTTKY
jgi:hypothetical protein